MIFKAPRTLCAFVVVNLLAALAVSTMTGVVAPRAANAASAALSQSALPLNDTAYPIPAGALYVSPSGSDSAAGTQAAPLRTLGNALTKAASGDTIVLRAGTYRESINSITRRVTIQPYPHEKVWLKGSVVVTNWVPSGTKWVASGWTTRFCTTCIDPTLVQASYPAAGYPDQVFIDNLPQDQVLSASAVVPGTFYVDTANSRLILGSNPVGHLVESSTMTKAMQFNTTGAAWSVVRGIGFAQYAPNWSYSAAPAALIVNTSGITLENVTVAQSASRGVYFKGGSTLRSSYVVFNGMGGISANDFDNGTIESSTIASSNMEHLSIAATGSQDCAGIKLTSSTKVVMQDDVISDNLCNGAWFDVSSSQITIVRNLVQRNAGHGIAVEISANAIVASNVSTDNGRLGLKLSGSSSIQAYNNTLANNGTAQIGVYEDPRTNPNSTEFAAGITWDAARIKLVNNILSSNAATLNPVLHVFDTSKPKHLGAANMISLLDGNAWTRNSSTSPTHLTNWPTSTGTNRNASNFAALRSVTAMETHGWGQDSATSPFFVNQAAGDYHLYSGSVGENSGQSLPASIAAAIGVPSGQVVDRGALLWPKTVTPGG